MSEYFHIDESEGTVFLKKSLDHETIQHHHFTIKVSDKGSPTLSSSKFLSFFFCVIVVVQKLFSL
jgi:hypothetical protein